MKYTQKLREKILSAPESCGVYLMRDNRGQVIYVGKANSLKKRLFSYLGDDLDNKTASLMAKAMDIEFRLCVNEAMALLLEAGLIRQLRPKYNVSLKDDKSFPFVRISKEAFPSIYITRKKDATGRYLGPYTNAALLKNALKIIRRSFAYRSCRRLPKESCVYFRINLCPAPCIGKISSAEYRRIINSIILILEGKTDLLARKLSRQMQDKSKGLDFEAAARIRDQITVLSEISAGSGPVKKPTALYGAGSLSRKTELQDLKNRLGLGVLPERIEGFDVSNISGKQPVGSMVSFLNGAPDKNNYRRFRIKSFSGIDDYKMLGELIHRRYSRLIRENKPLPDLLLIDGGKGHLLTARRKLEELNLNIPLVSIAKPRKKAYGFIRGREKENIYSSRKGGMLNFPEDAPAMNLIRRVRDEAHRFALGYHHVLRRKELINV